MEALRGIAAWLSSRRVRDSCDNYPLAILKGGGAGTNVNAATIGAVFATGLADTRAVVRTGQRGLEIKDIR
jgi:hypothetical protein